MIEVGESEATFRGDWNDDASAKVMAVWQIDAPRPEKASGTGRAADTDNGSMDQRQSSRKGLSTMERGINVVALVKDAERYIFLYDNDSTATLLQTLGRFAGDTDLSFSWYDAAVLSQRVRRLHRESEERDKTPFRAPRASR